MESSLFPLNSVFNLAGYFAGPTSGEMQNPRHRYLLCSSPHHLSPKSVRSLLSALFASTLSSHPSLCLANSLSSTQLPEGCFLRKSHHVIPVLRASQWLPFPLRVKPQVLPLTPKAFHDLALCIPVSPSAAGPILALLQAQWPLCWSSNVPGVCPPWGLDVGCPHCLGGSTLRWSHGRLCHLLQIWARIPLLSRACLDHSMAVLSCAPTQPSSPHHPALGFVFLYTLVTF